MVSFPKMKKLFSALLAICFLVLPLLAAMPVSAATTVAITSPTSGASVSGSSFTVTGTATAARNISVKVNGAVVGTTTSDGGGNWSLDVTGQSPGVKTIEATASYRQLYVNSLNVGSFSDSVMTKINPVNNQTEGTFSLLSGGTAPLFWKPNTTFTKAYGAAGPLGSPLVYVIDLVNETTSSFTMAGTSPNPSGIAYNADETKVYIPDADGNNDVVHVYNTTTNAEIGSGIAVGDVAASPAWRPGTNEIWVPNQGDSTISVINTVTDTVVDTYALGGPAGCVFFNDDGSKAYAGQCGTGNTIYEIDGATGTTTDTLVASGTIGYLPAINHAGTRLYFPIVGLGDNSVDVFDTSGGTLLQTIAVGPSPIGVIISDDDSKLYVTNANGAGGFNGTTISVVDTSNNTVINTITVAIAPAVGYFKPLESASTSISFTLSGLADTGQNQVNYMWLGVALIGASALIIVRQRYSSR